MITEELVTFETAQLAQKKGWNVHICRCGGYPECICHSLRPTQSILQRWLREEKKIFVFVNYRRFGVKECDGWYWHMGESPSVYDSTKYLSYESALEVGLQEALGTLKKVKK
jgi:hypothetical protein